jgi:hypothetical protein
MTGEAIMKLTVPKDFFLKHPLDKPGRWKWHFWFAWRPIQLLDNSWVWGEKIERRMCPGTNWEGDNWHYAYRAIGSRNIPNARTEEQIAEDEEMDLL